MSLPRASENGRNMKPEALSETTNKSRRLKRLRLHERWRPFQLSLALRPDFSLFIHVGFAFAAMIVLKLALFPIVTPDMTYYLLPWLQHIDVRGLASLGDEFTDYAPGYTYILLLASKISAWIPPVSSIKLMSVAADCVMAIVGGLLAARISNNALRGGLTAAVLVALPTVVLNSAAWGQSDSDLDGRDSGVRARDELSKADCRRAVLRFGCGLQAAGDLSRPAARRLFD